MIVLNRAEVEELLINNVANNLEEFVMHDERESLVEYVIESERYDRIDYDTLWNLADSLGLIAEEDK